MGGRVAHPEQGVPPSAARRGVVPRRRRWDGRHRGTDAPPAVLASERRHPHRHVLGSASRLDRHARDRPAHRRTDGVGQPGRGRDDARRRHHRGHGEHDAHARHRPHPPVARWEARLHDVRARATRGRERSSSRASTRSRRSSSPPITGRSIRVSSRGPRSRSEAEREARRARGARARDRLRGHARARGHRRGPRQPRELGPGGQRVARPRPRRCHDDVHRAPRPEALGRPRAGRERHRRRGRSGPGRARPGRPAPEPTSRRPPRRRLHRELARRLRGRRSLHRRRVQLRRQRRARDGRRPEHPRPDHAPSVGRERREQALPVRRASRCSSPRASSGSSRSGGTCLRGDRSC